MLNFQQIAEERKEAVTQGLVRDYRGGVLTWEKALSAISGLSEILNLIELLEVAKVKENKEIEKFL